CSSDLPKATGGTGDQHGFSCEIFHVVVLTQWLSGSRVPGDRQGTRRSQGQARRRRLSPPRPSRNPPCWRRSQGTRRCREYPPSGCPEECPPPANPPLRRRQNHSKSTATSSLSRLLRHIPHQRQAVERHHHAGIHHQLGAGLNAEIDRKG